MSRILKSRDYLDTKLTANGVRVLRSADKDTADENGRLTTPLGLTLEEWQEKVDKVRRDTDAEAKSILEKARKDAESILSAAREQGYGEGYSQGYSDGLKQGKIESEKTCHDKWDEKVAHLGAIVEELTNIRPELIKRYKKDIIDLATEAAQKVTSTIVDSDNEVILKVINECLSKAGSPTSLCIRVNDLDLESANTAKKQIAQRFVSLKSLEVVADDSVSRGGCLIETDSGYIDARIDRQLTAVNKAINESIGDDDG